MSTKIDAETVKSYLLGLQDRICAALEHELACNPVAAPNLLLYPCRHL